VPYADARRLYRLAASLPGIIVRGVDAHIGSQIVDVEPYRLSVERILELVGTLRRDGIELEFIDVGGGFGISYDEEHSPSATDFADVLKPMIAGSGLRLLLEPGRFIVGPAGVLLARVIYIKEMGEKTFVITDAGMNDAAAQPLLELPPRGARAAARRAAAAHRGHRRSDLRERRLPRARPATHDAGSR
jgi:diaminopimelate decarboxylase